MRRCVPSRRGGSVRAVGETEKAGEAEKARLQERIEEFVVLGEVVEIAPEPERASGWRRLALTEEPLRAPKHALRGVLGRTPLHKFSQSAERQD